MSMSMGGGGVKAEPNVTPMIDVMLVLLIIFMIVIPALNAGFTATPPKGQNLKPHPEEDQDQVLGIDSKGQYYLNKKPLPNADLETRLKAIYDTRQVDKIMYLKAHKELKYEKVIDALDIAAHRRCARDRYDYRPDSGYEVDGCRRQRAAGRDEGRKALMSMSAGGDKGLTNEPNVTPMIDVLLVLLIIFMMIIPLSRKAIDVQLPDPTPTKEPPSNKPDQIVLEVLPGGSGATFAINKAPVDHAGLGQRLKEIYENRPEKILFVKGDPEVTYQDVIFAMDMARGAGVLVIGAAPKPAGK